MTPLRKKMVEDLRLRNLSEATVASYVRCVAQFARFFHASPSDLGTAEVRDYLLHLRGLGRAPATRAVCHAALLFLYTYTLERPEVMAHVPRPRVPGHPVPLTRAEARALLEAFRDRPFDYTFFALMLATGLRISEARQLCVGDIDRQAQLVHVRRDKGKGGKARSVMLSPRTLRLLERYWVVVRPREPLLFPAQRLAKPGRVAGWADHPVSKSTMSERLLRIQRERVFFGRRITSHDLRRTFATWLTEDGCDLRLVQVLLGHASPNTTARYTRIHADVIARTPSPFDRL
jgi:integrase